MKPPAKPQQETRLKKELKDFNEQSARVINAGVNRLFDLKPKSARQRLWWIIFLLLLAGFLFSLRPHPLSEWIGYIDQIFDFMRRVDFIGTINSVTGFVNLGLQAFINPHTLWYFPAFFLPIVIAYQAASFYLADIFELERIEIARKFILQVSLTGSNDVIRMKNGEISQEHLESPIYKIGGPGKVIVDLDSVILFEKADGRPNVIGPTGQEQNGKAVLEGFERIRKVLDLRDQFVDLRDMDGKFSAVKGRSLDGINVIATDVRLMFSINRGDQEPKNDLPYPFTDEAVKRHVYKTVSQVTNQMRNEQSIPKLNFEGAIISMIRRELGNFMSQRKLVEYLASINLPEILKAEKQEDAVIDEARQVLEPIESANGVRKPTPSRPNFVPRYEITSLFGLFAKKFTKDAKDKGVELHWIGVGTWKVPNETVSEKHIEAWKMSRENEHMVSDDAIKSAGTEARTQKIISMIQDVPLGIYHDGIGVYNKDEATTKLCTEYLGQLKDNFEHLHTKKKRIPPTLTAAKFYISKTLRSSHSVYSEVPAPKTNNERDLYETLLKKVGYFEVVEQLIELEREVLPNASREEIMRKVNMDWDRDIAGNWNPNSDG